MGETYALLHHVKDYIDGCGTTLNLLRVVSRPTNTSSRLLPELYKFDSHESHRTRAQVNQEARDIRHVAARDTAAFVLLVLSFTNVRQGTRR